jgi:hypothetical protein
MVSVVPEPFIVAYIRRITTSELDPDTADPVVVDGPPIIRKAQSLSQIGQVRGSSRQIMSLEFLKRVETSLHLSVSDPSVYSPTDQVLLYPSVDDAGNYVPGSGIAYFVDGVALDARTSPWPQFTKMFGGTVEIRRVT